MQDHAIHIFLFTNSSHEKISKKMRQPPEITVLHIAPTPFFADRGCHIRIRNEIDALKPHNVRVVLCTYPIGQDIAGVDIRRTWRIPGYTKLDAGYSPFKLLADILLFFLVLKTAWQERPTVLHGHLHEGALVGWAVRICLFWRPIRLVMDMQGSLAGELAAYRTFSSLPCLIKLFKGVEWFVCRLPDFFFCSSEQSRTCLVDDFGVKREKTALLQDVVPDIFFQVTPSKESQAKQGVPPGKRTILYTGSLLPGKGIQHILEAMQILLAERDDLFFVLVGYPVDEAEIFIQEKGLTDHCLLAGRVAYSDLPNWLALADLALEPKGGDSGEASGKLLHYLAAGLPVVCFDTSNNRNFLGDLGYFAETNTPQALAKAICKALQHDQDARQRGLMGREVVKESYSIAGVGKILSDLYRELLINRP